jgi:toxin ParE1/3/4
LRRLVVAPRAERDIDDILARSGELFGAVASERYRCLIERAIANLLADSARLGVRGEPGLPLSIRLYPLWSAARSAPAADRVSRPRHVIVFGATDTELRIARVLHDRMNVQSLLGGR